MADIEVPKDTKVLVIYETEVGEEHPFSKEKLSPVLAYYKVKNEEEAYKVLSKRGWIMKGIVMTDAFLVKLGERFGFDGRKLK